MKFKYGGIVSALLLSICGITWAQSDYSVLLQESPQGAGQITPGIGVHQFGARETITINTAPKKGYHFVTWLGDVADPAANRTQLTIDGPKIIIAVFERDQYEMLAADLPQVSLGPEAMYPRYVSYTNSNGTWDPPYNPPNPPDDPPYDPPPVPEPLTITMFGVGISYLFRKRLIRKVYML